MQGLGCVHQEHLSPNAPWTQTLASTCPKWPIKAVKTLWSVCSLNTCTFRFSCWDGITLIQRISKLPSARLLWAVIRKKKQQKKQLYRFVLPKQPHSLNELVCRVWLNVWEEVNHREGDCHCQLKSVRCRARAKTKHRQGSFKPFK